MIQHRNRNIWSLVAFIISIQVGVRHAITKYRTNTHRETLINPCQQGERKSGRGVYLPCNLPTSQYFLNIARIAVGSPQRQIGNEWSSSEFRGERPRVASRRLAFENSETRWSGDHRHKCGAGISIFAGRRVHIQADEKVANPRPGSISHDRILPIAASPLHLFGCLPRRILVPRYRNGLKLASWTIFWKSPFRG